MENEEIVEQIKELLEELSIVDLLYIIQYTNYVIEDKSEENN
jgi:hypothetical protein